MQGLRRLIQAVHQDALRQRAEASARAGWIGLRHTALVWLVRLRALQLLCEALHPTEILVTMHHI